MTVLPAVQAFIDPTYGNTVGGIVDTNGGLVFAAADFSAYIPSFDIATGALESRLHPVDDGVQLDFCSTAGGSYLWTGLNDASNNGGIAQFKESDLSLVETWGFASGFASLPLNVPYPNTRVYLQMGSTAWLVQGGFVAHAIDVLQATGPLAIGFWGHEHATGSTMFGSCAGAQSAASAVAYSLDGTWQLYKTTITAGAEAYDPATWPATNPNIATVALGAAFVPTDIDAAWASIARMGGPIYDKTDGNLLLLAHTTDAVPNQIYVLKVNATTRAVIWATPVDGMDETILPCYSRIKHGTYLFCGSAHWYSIDTATGVATATAIAGLGFSAPGLQGSQTSDDVLGGIFANWQVAQTGGKPTLLNATPANFSSYAVMYLAAGGGGGGSSASAGDMQFFGQGP